MAILTCKTELRHLDQLQRSQIEKLLNECDSWKDLITIIPKEIESLDTDYEQVNSELLIDNEKCLMLEKQKLTGSPSRALLDYWSTYGIRRPSIEHLIYYASKCELYRLVDYLIIDLLKSRPIDEYSLKTKKLLIHKFEREQKSLIIESDQAIEFQDEDDRVKQIVPGVRKLHFELVKKYTNNFNENRLKDGGNKVGEGGFGVVYLAKIPKTELVDQIDCELDFTGKNYLVAVKVVANDFKEQYNAELKNLAEYRHPNLLNLIGLACDQTTWCILSEYAINNSLQDCLLHTNIKPIGHEQRIQMIKQIIDAICYLHTAKSTPLIHRDVN